MVIFLNTQYYNKIEIRKYTNNKYYDYVTNFLLHKTYLLKDIFVVSRKIMSSQDK